MRKSLPTLLICLSSLAAAGHSFAATAPSKADLALVMPFEWQEFRFERLSVIQADPALSAADEKLHSEMVALNAKIDAATVKADPSVAPLMKKLTDLLQNAWKKTPSAADTITPAQWQQLRAARAAALKADPALAAANKHWQKEKHAFQAQVDAALVKADPSTAAYLSPGGDSH